MVTQKDYVAIAEILREEWRVYGYPAPHKRLTKQFADYFTTQNPRFDRSRFMKACGLTE